MINLLRSKCSYEERSSSTAHSKCSKCTKWFSADACFKCATRFSSYAMWCSLQFALQITIPSAPSSAPSKRSAQGLPRAPSEWCAPCNPSAPTSAERPECSRHTKYSSCTPIIYLLAPTGTPSDASNCLQVRRELQVKCYDEGRLQLCVPDFHQDTMTPSAMSTPSITPTSALSAAPRALK
jgi:hypothetical protein